MSEVFAAAQKYLKKDRFSVDKSDGEGYSSDEPPETKSDESSSEDEEDTRASHRHVAKKETRKKDKTSEPKQAESAKEKLDSMTEDLTQRLERLTILMQAIHKQQLGTKPAQSYMQQACPCFMCGQNEPHGMKDCPETIAFMASGTVMINTEGRIVRADGKPLPRGIIGAGRIAKILKEEASKQKGTASSIELDQESFLAANYEFAQLNNLNSEYTIMPAQRDDSNKKDIRNQPYRHPETRPQTKKHVESSKKTSENSPKNSTHNEPPVRKILQCVAPAQDEDVEMESTPDPVKPKPIPKMIPEVIIETKKNISKPKVTFEDVKILDTPTKERAVSKPKRASPSFKFSSTVQESINQDELLKRILDEPIKISFRELLSSYEMAKCIQAITKSQKISINPVDVQKSVRMEQSSRANKANSARIEEITDEFCTQYESPILKWTRTRNPQTRRSKWTRTSTNSSRMNIIVNTELSRKIHLNYITSRITPQWQLLNSLRWLQPKLQV